MNKLALIPLSLFASSLVVAQIPNPAASNKSRNYHRYRLYETSPPYGLGKVEALVKKIKPGDDDSSNLAAETYNSLSFHEKFTYVMIHREQLNQNCDAMPEIVGEETKIFGHLPDFDDQMGLSDRETAFLDNNKSRVSALLRKEITGHAHVGLNTKAAIVQMDAYSLIPSVVSAFNRNPKDLDLLTTLMLLMKDGKYGPFLASATYKKLYGSDSDYQNFVVGNIPNQKLTIARALAFYHSKYGG